MSAAAKNGTATADDKAAKKAKEAAKKAKVAAAAQGNAGADATANAGAGAGAGATDTKLTSLLSSLGLNLRDVEERAPQDKKADAAKKTGAKAVRNLSNS